MSRLQLASVRKTKRLSQAQVACLLGVSVSTIARWEQGRREPSLEMVYKLAFVLNCEPSALLCTLSEIRAYGNIS